jgi:hypothetical protein
MNAIRRIRGLFNINILNRPTRNGMIKVHKEAGSEDGCVSYVLEQLKPINPCLEPVVGFHCSGISDVSLVLGDYQTKNLKVTCSIREVYEDWGVALTFELADLKLHANSVFIAGNSFTIPLDAKHERSCLVEGDLGEDFIDWLYGLEKLTWD